MKRVIFLFGGKMTINIIFGSTSFDIFKLIQVVENNLQVEVLLLGLVLNY